MAAVMDLAAVPMEAPGVNFGKKGGRNSRLFVS